MPDCSGSGPGITTLQFDALSPELSLAFCQQKRHFKLQISTSMSLYYVFVYNLDTGKIFAGIYFLRELFFADCEKNLTKIRKIRTHKNLVPHGSTLYDTYQDRHSQYHDGDFVS